MATTTDKALNRKIVEKARKMKSYAYASDDPEISDFSHPSVINIADTAAGWNINRWKQSCHGKKDQD